MYCTIDKKVKNNKGEIVDSILYKQLEDLLGKKEANTIYFKVATNPDWLNTLNKKKKDANGEITLKSLLRHSGLDQTEVNKIIKKLNNNIYARDYTFETE